MLNAGDTFGRLTVLELDHISSGSHRRRYYKCKCNCSNGNIIVVEEFNLKTGHTKSCGCLQSERTSMKNSKHKLTNTRFYKIWSGMKSRCYNINSTSYKNYGGRGIEVCRRWHDFENFYDDMYESYVTFSNKYGKKNTSLDRLNVDENYSLSNCRWATAATQANNKRTSHFITYHNETHTMKEWSSILGISYTTFANRINNGWDLDKAFRNINYLKLGGSRHKGSDKT